MPKLKIASKAQQADALGMYQIKQFIQNEKQQQRQIEAAKVIQQVAKRYINRQLLQSYIRHRKQVDQFYCGKCYDLLYVEYRIKSQLQRIFIKQIFLRWNSVTRQLKRAISFSNCKLQKKAFYQLIDESVTFIPNYNKYEQMIRQFKYEQIKYTFRAQFQFMYLRIKFLKALYAGYNYQKIFQALKQQYQVLPPFQRFEQYFCSYQISAQRLQKAARQKMLIRPVFIAWFMFTWRHSRSKILEMFARRNQLGLYGQYFHAWATLIRIKKKRLQQYLNIWRYYVGQYVDQSIKLHYVNKFQQRHYKQQYFDAWKRYVLNSTFMTQGKLIRNIYGPNSLLQAKSEQYKMHKNTNIIIFFYTSQKQQYKPIATAIKSLFMWKQLPKQRKSFNRFTLLMFGLYSLLKSKLKLRMWQCYHLEVQNRAIILNNSQDCESTLFDAEFVAEMQKQLYSEVLLPESLLRLINITRQSPGHALQELQQEEQTEVEQFELFHKYKRLVVCLNDSEIEESIRTIFKRNDVQSFITFFLQQLVSAVSYKARCREKEHTLQLKPQMDEEKEQQNFVFQEKQTEKILARRYLNYLVAIEQQFSGQIVQKQSSQQQLVQVYSQSNPPLANYIAGVQGINFTLAQTAFSNQNAAFAIADIPLQSILFQVCKYLQFDCGAVKTFYSFFSQLQLYESRSVNLLIYHQIARMKETRRAIVAEQFRNRFPPKLQYNITDQPQEWLVATLLACLVREYGVISSSRRRLLHGYQERVERHQLEQICQKPYDQLNTLENSSESGRVDQNVVRRTDEYVLRAFNYDASQEKQFISDVLRNAASSVSTLYTDVQRDLSSAQLSGMARNKAALQDKYEIYQRVKEEKERRAKLQLLIQRQQEKLRRQLLASGYPADKIDAELRKLQQCQDENALKSFVKDLERQSVSIDIDDEYLLEIQAGEAQRQSAGDGAQAHPPADRSISGFLQYNNLSKELSFQQCDDNRGVELAGGSGVRSSSQANVLQGGAKAAVKQQRGSHKHQAKHNPLPPIAAQKGDRQRNPVISKETLQIDQNGAVEQRALPGKKLPVQQKKSEGGQDAGNNGVIMVAMVEQTGNAAPVEANDVRNDDSARCSVVRQPLPKLSGQEPRRIEKQVLDNIIDVFGARNTLSDVQKLELQKYEGKTDSEIRKMLYSSQLMDKSLDEQLSDIRNMQEACEKEKARQKLIEKVAKLSNLAVGEVESQIAQREGETTQQIIAKMQEANGIDSLRAQQLLSNYNQEQEQLIKNAAGLSRFVNNLNMFTELEDALERGADAQLSAEELLKLKQKYLDAPQASQRQYQAQSDGIISSMQRLPSYEERGQDLQNPRYPGDSRGHQQGDWPLQSQKMDSYAQKNEISALGGRTSCSIGQSLDEVSDSSSPDENSDDGCDRAGSAGVGQALAGTASFGRDRAAQGAARWPARAPASQPGGPHEPPCAASVRSGGSTAQPQQGRGQGAGVWRGQGSPRDELVIAGIKPFDRIQRRAVSAPQLYYKLVPARAAPLRACGEARSQQNLIAGQCGNSSQGDWTNESVFGIPSPPGNGPRDGQSITRRPKAPGAPPRKNGAASGSEIEYELFMTPVSKRAQIQQNAAAQHTRAVQDNIATAVRREEAQKQAIKQITQNSVRLLNKIAEQSKQRALQGTSGQRGAQPAGPYIGRAERLIALPGSQLAREFNIVDIQYQQSHSNTHSSDSSYSLDNTEDSEDVAKKPKINIFNEFDKLFARVGVNKLQDIVAQRHKELMKVIEQESADDEFTRRLQRLAEKQLRKRASKIEREKVAAAAALVQGSASSARESQADGSARPSGQWATSTECTVSQLSQVGSYLDGCQTSYLGRVLIDPQTVVFDSGQMNARCPEERYNYCSNQKVVPRGAPLLCSQQQKSKKYRPLLVYKSRAAKDEKLMVSRVMGPAMSESASGNIVQALNESLRIKELEIQKILFEAKK